MPADHSTTAEITSALPDSRVVKAFDTTSAATPAAGTVGPLTTTVLITDDDTDAKATLPGPQRGPVTTAPTTTEERIISAGSTRDASPGGSATWT